MAVNKSYYADRELTKRDKDDGSQLVTVKMPGITFADAVSKWTVEDVTDKDVVECIAKALMR